jgi:kynureninase
VPVTTETDDIAACWTEARARAAADPLAGKRDLFHLPAGLIYLDGNSLGPAPISASAAFGAGPGEVVVCDTVSVNLHKALDAALGLRPGRSVIAAEGAGVHTDRYVAEGLAAARPGTRLALEGRDAPRFIASGWHEMCWHLCQRRHGGGGHAVSGFSRAAPSISHSASMSRTCAAFVGW